jgi:hypothetical protein
MYGNCYGVLTGCMYMVCMVIVSVCLSVCRLKLPDQVTDFHETRYKRDGTGGQVNVHLLTRVSVE